MARKKKEVNNTPTPKLHKTNSQLSYHGDVKIELKRGDKTYKTITQHNEGTPELFRFLANALAGNMSNKASAPKYIHTFYNPKLYLDNESHTIDEDVVGNNLYGKTINCSSSCVLNVPYSNVEVRYDAKLNNGSGGYKTEFMFMIPFSQISGNTNILALYNATAFGNNVIPLAYIKLEYDSMIKLEDTNTSNLTITWTMTVVN